MRGDELRQEGHVEQDDLRVQKVDAETRQPVLEQRMLLAAILFRREGRSLADRLHGQPDQIARSHHFQRRKGCRRRQNERRKAERHHGCVNDDASAGASHAGKACGLAFGQGAPDEKRHVRTGGNGKDRGCYRELDKNRPFGNEGQVCQKRHRNVLQEMAHARIISGQMKQWNGDRNAADRRDRPPAAGKLRQSA